MGILSITLGVLRRFTGGIDPILKNWFAGMNTPPSKDVQKIFNTYFIDYRETINGTEYRLKDIIAKADVLYFPVINNTNDSWRNMVKNAHHGTISGSGLVNDLYWGWSNPSGTGYVDTDYNPNTQAVKYAQNDAGIAVYTISPTIISAIQYIISCYQSSSIRSVISLPVGTGYVSKVLNDGTTTSDSPFPFLSGLLSIHRVGTSKISKNQNITNISTTVSSTGVPNATFKLFKNDGSSNPYTGAINFVFIGSSLSDSEYQCLNNAVNQTLIQLLFYKYGVSNWGVQMAKSYFLELHNFEKYEAWEVYEFIKRHQSDYVDGAGTGYYYNTFGPSGQNKTIADYIMLFKAGGNLVANSWTKTGATLRWNQDGNITTSNTMPAYTRGTNLGIVTVTTTDGWNNVTSLITTQSNNSILSFYGNFPLVWKLKTSGNYSIQIHQNKFKVKFVDIGSHGNLMVTTTYIHSITYPGNVKINLNEIIKNLNTGRIINVARNSYSGNALVGDLSLITTEFQVSQTIIYGDGESARQDTITGTLSNVILTDVITVIQIYYCGITGGLSAHNKNITSLVLTGNRFNTAAVDNQLAVINTYFATTTPIKNLGISLQGVTMGIPTGGASNTDLLGIIAKHTAAGFTATITVRTS